MNTHRNGTKVEQAELFRLKEHNHRQANWKKWGPYLSERQWGTVREDYSEDGNAWEYFPHDHARSRVYRWGEDGIGGISDDQQNLCFAIALWNRKDPILKERLFGLNGVEGNHAEDVKELYYYLDNTPTHSYMKYLYKYPQSEYPYQRLLDENKSRTRHDPEFELFDTGIFDGNQYFDVFIEYAKDGTDDILIRIVIFNRFDKPAPITVLPTLWFRDKWSFGRLDKMPEIKIVKHPHTWDLLSLEHEKLGMYYFHCDKADKILFTENQTNTQRIFNQPNTTPFVKDAFHDVIVNGLVLAEKTSGTKSSPVYEFTIPGGQSRTINMRLTCEKPLSKPFGPLYENIFSMRLKEADEFYTMFQPVTADPGSAAIQRQAFAGLLWNKQYYNYEIETWMVGDPGHPPPSPNRLTGRNASWVFLFNRDIISMPDKWEYPWFASWDLAFHCIPLAMIDPVMAKKQLILMLREWYMHPNGQIPAYEWNFSDVNPPVHAMAALKVYQIEKFFYEYQDIGFIKRILHKLSLNFTWWVNRKDKHGKNLFQGGFLGMDNIGVFNRSEVPEGWGIEQADGTSWMAMYSLNLMEIALEIARVDRSYEDIASKFFEHFIFISVALNSFCSSYKNLGLWDEEDGFYHDVLYINDVPHPLKLRSLVGLTSLFAVAVIEKDMFETFSGFKKRFEWFMDEVGKRHEHIYVEKSPDGKRILLSLTPKHRIVRVLQKMFDETEFLSPYGIRSVSKYHEKHPFVLHAGGGQHIVEYEPGESRTEIFGGNSNWRGPIWFPMNYLLLNALNKYHHFYGDDFKVELPTGSGNYVTLWEAVVNISERLIKLFQRDEAGKRPVNGDIGKYDNDPHFRDHVMFYEYFHGDTGKGLGASHQCGWTAIVAEMLSYCNLPFYG
ncbi:MAG: glucosidase [Nitrospirae bacterium]|nr:glucosidase [Nitrospirota bacterium]